MRAGTHLIALFGPTGVGKTAVAVSLARRLRSHGERPVAISADALQVYQGLEILTGVATAAEQTQIEHRLVSFLPLDASFSAGQYADLAHAQIDTALAEGRRPIVVGGTGLYLRAALTELNLRPPPPEGVREHWNAELERYGAPTLHARLEQRASWAAEGIDPNDRQRIVRALELLDAQNEPDPVILSGALNQVAGARFRAGQGLDHEMFARAIAIERSDASPGHEDDAALREGLDQRARGLRRRRHRTRQISTSGSTPGSRRCLLAVCASRCFAHTQPERAQRPARRWGSRSSSQATWRR